LIERRNAGQENQNQTFVSYTIIEFFVIMLAVSFYSMLADMIITSSGDVRVLLVRGGGEIVFRYGGRARPCMVE